MAIGPAYTGGGMQTGATPAGQNPFGLDPATYAYLQQLSNVGQSVAGGAPQSPQNFQRSVYSAPNVQGQPNQLLLAILQMRAQEAAALGAPYQQGTAMQPPRYSLLSS